MIEDEIRQTDASKLVPGLSETELIQELVSLLLASISQFAHRVD